MSNAFIQYAESLIDCCTYYYKNANYKCIVRSLTLI